LHGPGFEYLQRYEIFLFSETSRSAFTGVKLQGLEVAKFIFNSEIHGISTRFNSDLHLPSTTLTLFQKGVFYSGSRVFNYLPLNNTDLFNNEKRFRSALKKHLLENCFYTLEEHFHSNVNDPGS
jgi:hypothetical protein